MAKVEKQNGEGGSTEGMFFHRFSGTPVSQYEFRLREGDDTPSDNPLDADDPRDSRKDVFVFEVRAELSKVISDSTNDGDRDVIVWKVLDSKPGKRVQRGQKKPAKSEEPDVDPNQMELSEEAGDWTQEDHDKADGTPPTPDADPAGGGGGKVTKLFSDGS